VLFELRLGCTPEERRVLGRLHRPVARPKRVNANVADASLGSDLRVSVRPVYNSRFSYNQWLVFTIRLVAIVAFLTLEVYSRVFAIAKTQEDDTCSLPPVDLEILRWN
jgi:hypothetical protein